MSQSHLILFITRYATPGLILFKILICDLNTNIDSKFLTFTGNTRLCETENVLNDCVMFFEEF